MSTIRSARAFQVDLPVKTPRQDAIQSFVEQETVFVEITTDEGLRGRGYSYTIGNGGGSVLAMLQAHLLPQLLGRDSREVEGLWRLLWSSTRATSVGAITALALAAVDTALWDLRCMRAGQPLWLQAGGHRHRCRSTTRVARSSPRGVPALPDGAARQPGRRDPQRRVRRAHPTVDLITSSPIHVENGNAHAPATNGLGIDWNDDAVRDRTLQPAPPSLGDA